jgi:2-polyprenyl-3-methyl-5-hydroxy-6-metoxy-1,4-benzoquinol methylase
MAREEGKVVRVAGGICDKGVVAGNTYDKYGSKNPLVRMLMRGFEQALVDFVDRAEPGSIHEVGCGEGYWVMRWRQEGLDARGSDVSHCAIDLARQNALRQSQPPGMFRVASIYDLEDDTDGAELIVCCEVLEHVELPEDALAALQGIVRKNLIVSVPREPLWRLMNLARGKYVSALGNTPGHVQHWSRPGITRLIAQFFDIVAVRSPLPWTILLCRRRP